MIELLAAVVILAIISAIAIPIMGSVIQKFRDRAFSAKALVMKEAASMYTRAQVEALEIGERKVPYTELVSRGFLNSFLDPDTK